MGLPWDLTLTDVYLHVLLYFTLCISSLRSFIPMMAILPFPEDTSSYIETPLWMIIAVFETRRLSNAVTV